MKKITVLISILILATLAILLFGCNANVFVNMDGKTKVIFELEGGVFQNCKGQVTYYYDIPESGEMLIYSPQTISSRDVTRNKYNFKGWFKTKTVKGNNAVYSDEWDFKTDTIDEKGVTLYAKWEPLIKHTYEVCYLDENNEKVVLGVYDQVTQGSKFVDWDNYAIKRIGYTVLGFTDEDGNPWDSNFTHPGGEEPTAVSVYVNYIKGIYKVVETGEQLVNALTRSTNIYLKADVDCKYVDKDSDGKAVIHELKFNNYKGTFIGNGHTVSNFEVWYTARKDDLGEDKITYASILGNAEGAIVTDVTFDNVLLDFSTSLSTTKGICIAPLSTSLTECTLTNVSVNNMTIKINKLPSNLPEDTITIISDNPNYKVDDASVITNCTISNITVEDTTKQN